MLNCRFPHESGSICSSHLVVTLTAVGPVRLCSSRWQSPSASAWTRSAGILIPHPNGRRSLHSKWMAKAEADNTCNRQNSPGNCGKPARNPRRDSTTTPRRRAASFLYRSLLPPIEPSLAEGLHCSRRPDRRPHLWRNGWYQFVIDTNTGLNYFFKTTYYSFQLSHHLVRRCFQAIETHLVTQ